jgi:hypothetical protein
LDGGRIGSGGLVKGLEALEFAEGVAVVALGGIDHALEAGEGAVGILEGVSERGLLVEFVGGVHLVDEDLGFGGGEAAEGPGGAYENIDQVALLGDGGMEALEVLVEEGIEMAGFFAGNDEGLGIDAGFQGVHGGTGFARGGAWARGGVGMGAIGTGCFHKMMKAGPIGGASLVGMNFTT